MEITFEEVKVGDAAKFRKTINDNFDKCRTSINSTESTVGGLSNTVNSLSGTVSGLNNTVNGTGSTQGLVSKVATLENQLNGNQNDIYPRNVIIIPYTDDSSEGVHFLNPNDTSKRKVFLTQNGILLYDEGGRMTANVSWDSIVEGGSSSTIPVNKGGTGKTTWTAKGVLYASDSGTLANTSAGTAGYLLQSGGSTANPSWRTVVNATTAKTAMNDNDNIPTSRTVLHGIEYMMNRTSMVANADSSDMSGSQVTQVYMARGEAFKASDQNATPTNNGTILWNLT